MTLPNFLVVGAAKAGTTALYEYLQQHPQIYLSRVKEPRYFAFAGRRPAYRGPHDEENFNRVVVTAWDEYRNLFRAAQAERAIGEMSSIYLNWPGTAERIRRCLADVKLVAVLRQPADRAFSHYLALVRDGSETLSFEQALRAEETRIKDQWSPLWYYCQRGFYSAALEEYLDLFGSRRVKVFLYEDWVSNPNRFLADLFKFLGVDPYDALDMSRRHNVSRIPRVRLLDDTLNRENPVRKLARHLVPERLRPRIYCALQQWNQHRPQMKAGTRRQLIEVYRQDIAKLGSLIRRDLAHWL